MHAPGRQRAYTTISRGADDDANKDSRREEWRNVFIEAQSFDELQKMVRKAVKGFLQDTVPENDPIPGAVIAIQTFGDGDTFFARCPHQSSKCFSPRGRLPLN